MTYTVCARVQSTSENGSFCPALLETQHNTIGTAAAQAQKTAYMLEDTAHPCKTTFFRSLREEFATWANNTYRWEDNSCQHYKLLGLSICFNDLDQAIQDGIPQAFIRKLTTGDDAEPQYEFLCFVSRSEDPILVNGGYTAEAQDRRAALSALAEKSIAFTIHKKRQRRPYQMAHAIPAAN